MDEEINKFDQISNIFSKFTEKNKENLIKTALSLLQIQRDSEEASANNSQDDKQSN